MNRDKIDFYLRRYATFVGASCAFSSVLGYLSPMAWFFDLFNHFVAYYAALLLVSALCLMIARAQNRAGIMVLFLGLNLFRILGVAEGARTTREPHLSIAHFNVNTANSNRQAILDAVTNSDADIALLLEIGPEWGEVFDRLAPPWRVHEFDPERDNFGLALLSRYPITNSRVVNLGPFSLATVEAEFEFDGEKILLVGVHAAPPLDAQYAHARDEQFKQIARRVKTSTRASIVIGDFNATPWSRPLLGLLKEADLKNAYSWYSATWPAGGLIRIPIDLSLHSKSLVPTQRRIEGAMGSDHNAVYVSFGRAKNSK